MMIFLIFLVFALVIALIFALLKEEYIHAKISHKYKKYGTHSGYEYYFIVLYMDNATPKSTTIRVKEEVYEAYNVDDKITI